MSSQGKIGLIKIVVQLTGMEFPGNIWSNYVAWVMFQRGNILPTVHHREVQGKAEDSSQRAYVRVARLE